MDNLFKKVACFTDIHFGNKSNSKIFNQDCDDFVDWFIDTAHKNDCETCIFLGDWHHHRSALNVDTMDHSLRNLEKVAAAFEHTYFILGNHDLYYKENRSVNSVVYGRNIPNLTLINEPLQKGNVVITPWLVGEEHRKLKQMKCKYMFGHFELPNFLMNAMVRMPDIPHGVQYDDFDGIENVFSGHFHKRQVNGNVTYMGNAFPHTYADADDDKRGMMILECDEYPKFIDWPDCPKYRVYNLSEVLDDPTKYFSDKMYVRLKLDVDITYEEANFIKETFMKQFNLREIALLQSEVVGEDSTMIGAEIKFESVDQIVYGQLDTIDSDNYDKAVLREIYRDL